MKKIVSIVAAGVGLCILAFVYVHIQAQQTNQGLTLHPSNFDLSLTQGQTYSNSIYLDNHMDISIPVAVSAENFTAEGEEGGINLTTDTTAFSLAQWVHISPTMATIPPHGTQKFTYTITPPSNAEAGGHFGSLVFKTVPPSNLHSTGAALSQELASLILVRLPGDVTESAVVESLTTDKKFYEFGPVQFTLRIRNTGGVHIAPFGSVSVTDMFGNTYDAPIQTANVLPNSIRRISATLPNKFLIGPYTAHVVASYGSKNMPLYGSVEFYAFPVRYGIVILIVGVLLLLLRKRLAKAVRALVTGK